jgi:hypothetical protein
MYNNMRRFQGLRSRDLHLHIIATRLRNSSDPPAARASLHVALAGMLSDPEISPIWSLFHMAAQATFITISNAGILDKRASITFLRLHGRLRYHCRVRPTRFIAGYDELHEAKNKEVIMMCEEGFD